MEQEMVHHHINQQLYSIMAVDMDVNEYLESALTYTQQCLESRSESIM